MLAASNKENPGQTIAMRGLGFVTAFVWVVAWFWLGWLSTSVVVGMVIGTLVGLWVGWVIASNQESNYMWGKGKIRYRRKYSNGTPNEWIENSAQSIFITAVLVFGIVLIFAMLVFSGLAYGLTWLGALLWSLV